MRQAGRVLRAMTPVVEADVVAVGLLRLVRIRLEPLRPTEDRRTAMAERREQAGLPGREGGKWTRGLSVPNADLGILVSCVPFSR